MLYASKRNKSEYYITDYTMDSLMFIKIHDVLDMDFIRTLKSMGKTIHDLREEEK